jgi:predicted Zn-dependent peptidase
MTGGSSKYSPDEMDRIRGTFGEYNANTSTVETNFPVDMIAEDLGLYLDFVSDVAFSPLLESGRFEEERKRVLRETADAKGKPDFKDNNSYNEAFFGKDSPHYYFVLGDEKVVGSVSPSEMRQFHSRGYGASNMDLILAGDLPDDIEDQIKKNFENRERGDNTRFKFPKNPPLEDKVFIHSSAPDLINHDLPKESNAQFNISLPTSTRSDPDSYAVEMLVNILGGDGNSRLFQRVSQRLGFTYGIGSQYHHDNNVGIISTYSSIGAERSDEAIDIVFEEMRKLRENPVSDEELSRHRRISRYNIAKTFESNSGHVHAIRLKHDKGVTPESYLKKFDAVTTRDVQEAAIKYLPSSREDGKYVMMLRDPLKK